MYNASYSWSGPQLPKGCGCKEFLPSVDKTIIDIYSKREGGNAGNSGLKMVVHYPRTVWKNSFADHKVTGKNNKKTKYICKQEEVSYMFSHPANMKKNPS